MISVRYIIVFFLSLSQDLLIGQVKNALDVLVKHKTVYAETICVEFQGLSQFESNYEKKQIGNKIGFIQKDKDKSFGLSTIVYYEQNKYCLKNIKGETRVLTPYENHKWEESVRDTFVFYPYNILRTFTKFYFKGISYKDTAVCKVRLLTDTIYNKIQCKHVQFEANLKAPPLDSFFIETYSMLKKDLFFNVKTGLLVGFKEQVHYTTGEKTVEEFKYGIKVYTDSGLINKRFASINNQFPADRKYTPKKLSDYTTHSIDTGMYFLPKIKMINLKDSSLINKMGFKFVLIDFWYRQCAPCLAATPILIELQNKFASKKFTVIGLNPFDADGAIESISRVKGINFPQARISLKNVQNDLGIFAYPTFLIVKEDGKVIKKFNELNQKEISDYLNNLITSERLLSL